MSICILRMDADIWNLRLEKANVVKQIVRRGKAMSQNRARLPSNGPENLKLFLFYPQKKEVKSFIM